MRSVIYVLALVLVVAFAFGSYWIKYDTQERLAEIESLRDRISHEHERIAILEAVDQSIQRGQSVAVQQI